MGLDLYLNLNADFRLDLDLDFSLDLDLNLDVAQELAMKIPDLTWSDLILLGPRHDWVFL